MSEQVPTKDLVSCPFCGEQDFDLIGLKYHLQQGHCTNYNEMSTMREIRAAHARVLEKLGRKP